MTSKRVYPKRQLKRSDAMNPISDEQEPAKTKVSVQLLDIMLQLKDQVVKNTYLLQELLMEVDEEMEATTFINNREDSDTEEDDITPFQDPYKLTKE